MNLTYILLAIAALFFWSKRSSSTATKKPAGSGAGGTPAPGGYNGISDTITKATQKSNTVAGNVNSGATSIAAAIAAASKAVSTAYGSLKPGGGGGGGGGSTGGSKSTSGSGNVNTGPIGQANPAYQDPASSQYDFGNPALRDPVSAQFDPEQASIDEYLGSQNSDYGNSLGFDSSGNYSEAYDSSGGSEDYSLEGP
jgi:hypothetical protein